MMRASYYQTRLWMDWQLDPTSTRYNEILAYQLSGPLNLGWLKQALTALMYRHVLLRSVFSQPNKALCIQPRQEPILPFSIREIPGDFKTGIPKEILQEINAPFDLRVGPLWRCEILRLNTQEHYLILILHHIIADGRSFELLRKDLSRFYNQPSLTEQLPSQNAHDQLFQKYLLKEKISRKDAEIGLAYYREQLLQKSLHCDLLANSGGEPGVCRFFLDVETSKAVRQFCQQRHCSPFRFISSIYALFLYRYFGQEKFCMAYPIDMRNSAGQEIVGSFVNMQLLPVSLNDQCSFEDVLLQVSESRRIIKKLSLPYEKMVGILKKEKVIGSSDFANIVVSETDLKLKPLLFQGLRVKVLQIPKIALPYDLSLEFERNDQCFCFQLSIANGWFNGENSEVQLKEDFKFFISCALRYPRFPLNQLLFATPTDGLVALSQAPQPFRPSLLRIEERFHQIAEQYPHRVAIIEEGNNLTYAELSAMADGIVAHLATHLRSEDLVVGISMKHSAPLIAVILALFSLGRAYLPIRTDFPPAYAKEIIKEAQLKVLISDHGLGFSIPGLNVISLADLLVRVPVKKSQISDHSTEELAYILYTSGTSGAPKGVMIKHSSVVNLLVSCQPFYQLSCHDVVPWFHSYGFDFSVWEIWAPLLNGGALLILDEATTKSPRELAEKLSQHRVTLLNQTPSALKQLGGYLAQLEPSTINLSSLRTIITGGEALYPHHVEAILSHKTPLNCQIFNMYGITEDTVHSTIFEITKEYLAQRNSIIGKMLPGKEGVVVDEQGHPKPLGCPGELLISGFGVTEGYFQQAEMAKERFVQLPQLAPGKVWLKTGDQARLLPSGDLIYLGRKDTQTKIRGYRIDIQTIETHLNRLDGILDVKVLKESDQLIVFIVLKKGNSIATIKAAAKAVLPLYMLPSQWIKLQRLPLTLNNKINEEELRRFLQRRPQKKGPSQHGKGYTPVEQEVYQVWQQLLPGEIFDKDDHFFDCGGNSLLLVELQNQLEKRFKLTLPMIEFFKHPTISEMAKVICDRAV